MPDAQRPIPIPTTAAAEEAAAPVLSVRGLHAWYGQSKVLQGIDIEVGKGEIVTLLGRNGAGKTTTLRAILGLVSQRSGSILFEGAEIIKLPTNAIANRGIAYCPEERGIYATLSVRENMLLPPVIRPGGISMQEIDEMFPILAQRGASPGTKLSGGEQQMLAIARILRTGAKFLLLDEPTEGLAPVIVEQIGALIRTVKARGYTVLMVEQNFEFARSISDRYYVIQQGEVIDALRNDQMEASLPRIHSYLGV
jgi:branched-chain amino acid transport system ATP-binding protein